MRRKAPGAGAALPHARLSAAPLIYIALAASLVVDLAWLTPTTSGMGYLLVATGIPAYLSGGGASR